MMVRGEVKGGKSCSALLLRIEPCFMAARMQVAQR